MKRIPAADFVRNFSFNSDEALARPIVITRNGRDRLVLVSVEHYRQVLSLAVVAPDVRGDDVDELQKMLRFVG